MKTKRVALYIRCSTQEQNTDLQLRELTEYVNARGWQITKVYEDYASGTTSNRKMLQQLMSDCRRRQADIVCVWRLDRLFRSLKNMVVTLEEFNELGVEFVSMKDAIDMTSSTGRLMAHMISAFAEFEASVIKSRVVSGLQAARARGVRLGRPSAMTTALKEQIISLKRCENLSIRQIEKRIGRKVSRASVERVLKQSKLAVTKSLGNSGS